MLCFVVNLLMMFIEYVFLDRFKVVVDVGFCVVEYLFFYDYLVFEVVDCLYVVGFEQVLFNMLLGNWVVGECGFVVLFGCQDEFCVNVVVVLDYVCVFGCFWLYVMVGIMVGLDRVMVEVIYIDNICFVVDLLVDVGIIVLLELINSCNMFGYFIVYQYQVLDLIDCIDRLNVLVQLDLYYVQIMDGDLIMLIYVMQGCFGYVQIVLVFDWYEFDEGELNYFYFYVVLDWLGYDGWIGCEYNLCGQIMVGLGWFVFYWMQV